VCAVDSEWSEITIVVHTATHPRWYGVFWRKHIQNYFIQIIIQLLFHNLQIFAQIGRHCVCYHGNGVLAEKNSLTPLLSKGPAQSTRRQQQEHSDGNGQTVSRA